MVAPEAIVAIRKCVDAISKVRASPWKIAKLRVIRRCARADCFIAKCRLWVYGIGVHNIFSIVSVYDKSTIFPGRQIETILAIFRVCKVIPG